MQLGLTFTALAVSSENGGVTPESTAASDRPYIRRVAKTKDFFAPAYPTPYLKNTSNLNDYICRVKRNILFIFPRWGGNCENRDL